MRRLSEPDQGAWIPQYIWELASLWAVLCINTPTLQQLRLTGLLLFVVVKSIVRHKKDLELMLRLEDAIAPLCNLCFCTDVNRESLFKDSCLPQNSSSITKLWYFGPRAKSLHVWSPFVTFNYWKRTSENTFTRACSSKTKSTWVKCKKKRYRVSRHTTAKTQKVTEIVIRAILSDCRSITGTGWALKKSLGPIT